MPSESCGLVLSQAVATVPAAIWQARSELQALVQKRSPVPALVRHLALGVAAQSSFERQGSHILPSPTQAPKRCRQAFTASPAEFVLSAQVSAEFCTPPQSPRYT